MKLELESPSLTAAQEKLLLRFLDRLEKKYETGRITIDHPENKKELFRIVFESDSKTKEKNFIAVEKTFNKALNLLAKFIGV